MKTQTKIIFFIVVALGLVYFFLPKNVNKKENEYEYLAPYVKPNIQWGKDDYFAFLNAAKEKHLLEIAIACKVDGVSDNDLSNISSSISRIGGKAVLISEIQKDIIWDYSSAVTYIFKNNDVPYHKITQWVASKKDAKTNENTSTFMTEQAIISAIFVDSWNNMSEAQKKSVINQSELNKLTPEQKTAIIAGSGTAALAIISASAVYTGFAFYTTMTSVMCAIAGVFSITLPFAAYTGATTAVGVLSGPIGWGVIGVCAVGSAVWATGSNSNKSCENIIAIHMIKVKALKQAGLLK